MLNVEHIINAWGILAVALIIFAESGLLIGFFLPGDTLLFGAGLAASQGRISLPWLLIAVIVAAILGDNVGYSIGHRTGHRIFKKKDGILFRQEYLEKASDFYKRHGGKTIIIARFTPIVRTFAPVVAGASKMPRNKFVLFNVTGGVLWGGGMTLLGYFIGNRIPHLDQYIELVIFGVVFGSLALSITHILAKKQSRQALFGGLKSGFRKVVAGKNAE